MSAWGAGAKEPPLGGFDRSLAGVPVPDAPFVDAAENAHRLSDFRGRTVLLAFWATWCPACVAEMPALARLQAEMGGDDVAVIAVAEDERGVTAAISFLRRGNLGALPAYADPGHRLGEAFGQEWLPTTIVIDPSGREVARAVGEMDWDAPSVRRTLRPGPALPSAIK